MKKSVFYEHIAEAAVQSGLTIPEVLQQVKSFGIDGVEIEDKRLYSDSTIPEQLQNAGIQISCIYGFMNYKEDNERKQGEELVKLASSLNVHNILLIPGFVEEKLLEPEQKVAFQDEVHEMIEYVKSITLLASRYQITVGMEDFDDRIAPFSTIEGLKEFAEQVPLLKITFDTGNFLYSEQEELKAFDELEAYIGYVHLKDRTFDVKAGEQPKDTVKGRHMYSASVGSGVIQMREVLSRLQRNGYDGTLAIEHFGSQNQLRDMQASAEWIDKVWKEQTK